jgi:HAD superfamily hydrolase (TIGR01509 family)
MATELTSNRSIYLKPAGRRIEAVLFDMDGVLVDSIPLHIKAWNYVLSMINLPPLDRGTYLSVLGRTNMEMINSYLEGQKLPLPLTFRRDIVETKERYFRDSIRDYLETTPGVLDWLEFIKKKQVRCAVASSGEMSNIVTVLDLLHISDYFASIISGAHLPAGKPDPLIFKLAAASLGVKPGNCLVIEDAPVGIQAARSADMVCCALATTFSSDELKQADLFLENLAQAHPETLFSD